MAYIEWWNRTGPITMGERFGLNEISTARKTLSPTKSYAKKPDWRKDEDWDDKGPWDIPPKDPFKDEDWDDEIQAKDGGRIGLAQGTPLYTATVDNFKFLDNLILNTKKTLNEIKSAFGGEPTSGNQGINKLIEAWSASSKDRVLPKDRFKYYKFTADSPKVKEVIALFESGMSKKAIEFKTGISRKEIRKIFHQFKPEYIGEENLPSGEGKNAVKKRRLKLIKEYTDYWKNKSGGDKILEELNQKLRSIKLKNAEILTMSDEAILNNKVFKEAMNLDVKGLKAGEGINFNRYLNLTDAEYIAKVKAMAQTNQFYQPEHLIAINKKNPASMLPKNIYTAVGKMGGQLEVLKEHLKNNPDVKITNEIKALLKNQNISLPKSETIGSKAWDVTKKVGKYGIARPIAGITLPGTQIIPETVKAVKEKRLPNYNLTDPNTWVNAAFWNWAVKEWGFDKTVDKFGQSLKHLSTGDKARVVRNVVARAGLSPKAIQFISSRVAWPVAGVMSVHDAYKDYKRTDAAIKKRWEEDPEGMKKQAMEDAAIVEGDTSEMFAMGGIASLIK